MKTPNTKPKKTSESGSQDSLQNFIVDDFSSDDDFIERKPSFKVPKKSNTPVAQHPPPRRPLSQLNLPVFLGDSDDDDDTVIKSTWRTRHQRPNALLKANKNNPLCDKQNSSPFSTPFSPSLHKTVTSATSTKRTLSGPSNLQRPNSAAAKDSSTVLEVSSDDDKAFDTFLQRMKTPNAKPKKASERGSQDSLQNFIVNDLSDDNLTTPKPSFKGPSKLDESDSSEEEEFTSLLDRVKKKSSSHSSPPKSTKEPFKVPAAISIPPAKGSSKRGSKSLGESPGKSSTWKPTISQTEPRHGPTSRVVLCKTPGCFLQSLTNPGSSYVSSFKQNKEELTRKLYQLYNTTVFDSKLPINMSVTWNKKMRKTAGYCITGQERGGGSRYARIELSEKVCDSADRLRDTLIHEMCHAATWLINSVRDGHGNFWKMYARKATLVHPELPMVTRCHSYDIKYKFQYQCTRCKNTIGRHSKSLDTQRFVCSLCTGQFVLLTPSKPRAPTPFANFVKENYGNVRQQLAGQSHADVMRKLSADFASKTKLSES
ncbi:germ cell nuclear acidic protein isoform X2 [Parambassis ranga]|nr:acidic repeat-containing protein-like isoform X2 [Parambassis ranga]